MQVGTPGFQQRIFWPGTLYLHLSNGFMRTGDVQEESTSVDQALDPGCKPTPDFDVNPVEIVNCVSGPRARFREGPRKRTGYGQDSEMCWKFETRFPSATFTPGSWSGYLAFSRTFSDHSGLWATRPVNRVSHSFVTRSGQP